MSCRMIEEPFTSLLWKSAQVYDKIVTIIREKEAPMNIALPPVDRAEILQYLGWRGGEIPVEVRTQIDEAVAAVARVTNPRYITRAFSLERTAGGLFLAGCGVPLLGKDIASMLTECDRCVLIAATLGGEPEREIRTAAVRDMTRSLILDAVASTAIEAVMNAIDEEIQTQNADWFLTDRFSPGYGDMPLEQQRDLIRLLDTPRTIGLTLTDSLILTPHKSVTAVVGIAGTPQTKRFRGCAYCSMFENCTFRKAGKTCGKV